jgi:hypothetical protein
MSLLEKGEGRKERIATGKTEERSRPGREEQKIPALVLL